MSEGFPKPPFQGNRQDPQAIPPVGPSDPFKDLAKAQVSEDDPRLSEAETRLVFETYLRPDQRKDNKLMKFILSYLECRNSAQAAREAGLDDRKGHWYRTRPEVHACIEAITAKALMKYGYDAHEVMERVKEISEFDPIEFENPDGSFKTHMSQISPKARRAIKSFVAKNLYGKDANGMDVVIGQLIKCEVKDGMKAHELLGREKNILKETKKIEHDVTANMASLLLDSSRRGDEAMKAIDITPRLTGGSDVSEEIKSGDSDDAGRDGENVSVTVSSSEGDRDRAVDDFPPVPWEERPSRRV